jgi:5,10-methylenetetrahydromethanopterin reductase
MEMSIALASDTDSWRHVKRAESLGFHSAWFYDTQLLNPDVFICMALAAANTERIRLGTGVLIPSNRIEPVAANAFATLNKLAPGRIDFGVGTGFTGRRTMGLKAIPLAKMKTYVERVQAMLSGETINWDFEGADRKIRFLNPEFGLINIEDEIPLHMSAMGPRARRLTAELGAGWLNFGSDVDALVRDVMDMRQAWKESSRAESDLHNTLFYLGAVLSGNRASDERKLMAQAAPWTAVMFHNLLDDERPLAFDLPPVMAETLSAYRELHAEYKPEDARYLTNHRGHLMFLREEEKALISAELVRATTLSGTPDELVERIRQLAAAGYDQFALQLVQGEEEEQLNDWSAVFSRAAAEN